jgi:hypothetical protein
MTHGERFESFQVDGEVAGQVTIDSDASLLIHCGD